MAISFTDQLMTLESLSSTPSGYLSRFLNNEIRYEIRKLRNQKAAEDDGIPAEILKILASTSARDIFIVTSKIHIWKSV